MKDLERENMKKANTKEIRLNVNYVAFIASVKSKKLEQVNKEKLEEIYIQEMGLKPSNIQRVSKRVQRAKLNGVLKQTLELHQMSEKEFTELSNAVVEKLSKKKSNYVSVVA